MTTPERDDYDHPWKQVIEYAFRPFLAFFFPAAHAGIAWERGYTFLEQELHQITREAEVSTRHVDKLVQVWHTGGQETWLLIHIEVQSQEEAGFAERMFTYYYRLYDRYRVSIESLAILGDEGTRWRPTQFQPRVVWETALTFRFRSVKLLDYQAWEALEASDNPFALMVMAHLKTRETKHDGERRLHWKMTLVRRLYERGYGREDIVTLFRFLDWLMWLPEELTAQFWQTLRTYEEAHQMTYITSIERLGIEKGRAEGRQEGLRQGMLSGIELALKLKFGTAAMDMLPELHQIEDVSVLQAIHSAIETTSTPDDLRRLYQQREP